MAKFCTECGKEIAVGVMFCTECGAKLGETEPKPAPSPPPATPPPPTVQVNQPYVAPAPDNTSKVVGTGLYIGLMILFAIPIIGFIACIIMAFTAKNKNIKNYARATLIWMIIAFVLLAILIAIVSVIANTLTDYINQITDGQFGEFKDFFGEFSEIKNSMNEFGNITEQFENGGLSGLPIE